MKVVVAPNAFKGTLTASQAAAAIARGVREVFPDAEVVEVPVADGGAGTVEALVSANHGQYRTAEVEGPLGDPVKATYGLIGKGGTVLELAAASGLALVPHSRRDPRKTSTYGFGQLLHAARAPGTVEFIVGIGGSATNDGGAGMAQALGYRLLDVDDRDLPRGGAALARLERIDASGFESWAPAVKVRVACDVTNPLTGPQGASAVYGPQKGADDAAVRELDAALARFADVVERDLGKRVADVPGAGAAGGTGAGLMAFLDASLVRGAPLIVSASGFDSKLEGADLVITGEGHRRYVASIYRLVRRKLGDALLAEDIAQETFMKALRMMDRVDESFNFGGWVHTVARNLCYDELRRRQRDLRADGPTEEEDAEMMANLPSTARAFDPVLQQESNETRRQVWHVAQRLPEKYRLVLTLRELQDMSYRQIARTLKMSESAVETLLYRARLRFKEEYLASQREGELSHEEAVPLLAPYLAGKLRRPQADAVRDHIATCTKCARRIGRRRLKDQRRSVEK